MWSLCSEATLVKSPSFLALFYLKGKTCPGDVVPNASASDSVPFCTIPALRAVPVQW